MYETFDKVVEALKVYLKETEAEYNEKELEILIYILRFTYDQGWLAAMNRPCHDT